MQNSYKQGYSVRLYIGLNCALCFLIIMFYVFPVFELENVVPIKTIQPEIIVVNIPRTTQIKAKNKTRPILPVIPVPSDEPEILEEITIPASDEINIPALLQPGPEILHADELSFTPRQILEVVPENMDPELRGVITLYLRIGKDGKVKEHQVKENSTASETCLAEVIKSAYKTVWESVSIKNKTYEYWIEKSYRFE